MVINITTNTDYLVDLMDVARAFAPEIEFRDDGVEISINIAVIASSDLANDSIQDVIIPPISDMVDYGDRIIRVTLASPQNAQNRYINIAKLNDIHTKSEAKRLAKIMLYDYLVAVTNRTLPYGSITGIRPTKLYHELLAKGVNAYDYFVNYLRVSVEKTILIKQICENQLGIYHKDDHEIDVFVNIPICVTRCSYCSFISAEYSKITRWIEPYVAQLVAEIGKTRAIIANGNYTVRSIYVGGGTPTSLEAKDFSRVINALKGIDCREFTVEAGRPDTIDEDKLRIMADAGVNRISINPQSFNDKTLDLIGRKHSSRMIYDIYAVARKYDFIINMDLIAMLPEETLDDFRYSVDKCIELAPDNITVHTLAIKRGSNLKNGNHNNMMAELAQDMVDYSAEAMQKAGYTAYYMYKQKYMSGNLENVGYCRGNTPCIYNIDIMEETHSIIASGAGGISKRVWSDENRLERLANPKGIDVYLEREEKINCDKKKFFN